MGHILSRYVQLLILNNVTISNNATIISQVILQDSCPLPTVDMFWSKYCYAEARLWSSFYVGCLQSFTNMLQANQFHINLGDD